MKKSTLPNAVDITKEEEIKSILDSIEHRPLSERVRVVVRLLEAIESRYKTTLELLDANSGASEREGSWGYL